MCTGCGFKLNWKLVDGVTQGFCEDCGILHAKATEVKNV